METWEILDLVRAARGGDEAAFERLFGEYEAFVRWIARSYFIVGAGPDDVMAEAQFGFWKAVCDFRPDAGHNFKNFARLCVERHLITAVKTATRAKHAPLSDSARVSGDGEAVVDLLPDPIRVDPHDVLVRKTDVLLAVRGVATLTDLERRALLGIANGVAYSELDDFKRIDNAAQRARRKLARFSVDEPDVFAIAERAERAERAAAMVERAAKARRFAARREGASSRRRYTRDELIVEIQEWAARHGGVPPTVQGWGTAGGHPSVGVVVRVFGSWANGIEAAGFERPRRGIKRRDRYPLADAA